ncbi:reverse transcriptase domain-containing protein [Tanacetum coccineum]
MHKKSDFQWTPGKAEEAFKQMKKLMRRFHDTNRTSKERGINHILAPAKEAISCGLDDETERQAITIIFCKRTLESPDELHGQNRNTVLHGHRGCCSRTGSSCVDGSGAGLILTNPEGAEFTYAMRFRFDATNNEAEYEALIAGLRIAEKMGIKNLQANVDSKLVANQVNGSYIAKESGMPRALNKQVLVEELKEKSIDEKEILDIVEEEGNTWMTPICEYLTKEILPEDKKKARAVRRKAAKYTMINGTLYKKSFLGPWLRCVGPLQANYVLREIHEGSCSMHSGPRSVVATLAMYKQGVDIAGPFPEGPGKVKFLIVAIDYFTKWIEAKAVATITDNQVKKFVWDNIVCRFGCNFGGARSALYQGQCKETIIRQCFASVKHPQANGLVERANKSLGEGIKARLDKKKQGLDRRTSASVIPVEIGMPTLHTTEIDQAKTNEALGINLDLIEERREQAAIQEAKSKKKMENITTQESAEQVSSRVIWSTAAMKQVMLKTEGPYMKLKSRLERELTNSKTAKEMTCRGHRTFAISKNVIYMKCKNSPGTYDVLNFNKKWGLATLTSFKF